MKIDVEQELKSFTGQTLMISKDQPATFKTLVMNALLQQASNEPPQSGEEKMARFLLAESIYKCGQEIELVQIDIQRITHCVNLRYDPLIVGTLSRILNG